MVPGPQAVCMFHLCSLSLSQGVSHAQGIIPVAAPRGRRQAVGGNGVSGSRLSLQRLITKAVLASPILLIAY